MYPHWTKQPESETEWFYALMALARYLRTPDGCPWDREQSAADFAGFSREEALELVEAFADGNARDAEEEFGDTLFCLLAVAAAAEEEGTFRLEDALRRIHDKMIRRHEHVFGDETAATPEDATRVWNAVKARERDGG